MKQTVEEAARENVLFNYITVGRTLYGKDLARFGEINFVQGAEWQAKQFPWISVEDAIPNELAKGMCQVKYVDGSIDEMAMREVNKWIYPYIKTGYVTHWKPIPSFDEILEANKDVLERIKGKGD